MSQSSPVIEIIQGTPHEFPRLLLEDFDRLSALAVAENKALIKKAAVLCGYRDFHLPQLLLAAERDVLTIEQMQQSAWTVSGMRRILALSWQRAGRPAAELDALLKATTDPLFWAHLAYRLVTPAEEIRPTSAGSAPDAATATPNSATSSPNTGGPIPAAGPSANSSSAGG